LAVHVPLRSMACVTTVGLIALVGHLEPMAELLCKLSRCVLGTVGAARQKCPVHRAEAVRLTMRDHERQVPKRMRGDESTQPVEWALLAAGLAATALAIAIIQKAASARLRQMEVASE
jgi:hypothetical protein